MWDPTQQGRSKIFANYGRYYEAIPLDIADRGALAARASAIANHDCDPRAVGSRRAATCATANRGSNIATAPTVSGGNARSTRSRWTPISSRTANDELVAGAEYEVLPNARLGLNYTYRNLVRTMEDMSGDDGEHLLHRQPRRGHRDTFPKAKRTYHAVTVQLHEDLQRPLAGAGQLHLVAAARELRGPVRPGTGQLDPEHQRHLRPGVSSC